jgi:hypothetical protein
MSGVRLGTTLVWLQTHGEVVLKNDVELPSTISGEAYVVSPVPSTSDQYPESFHYDADRRELRIGEGVFGGVARGVIGFSVSGFRPVESWLRYRMLRRGGRAGREGSRSPLDELRPASWCFTDELLALLWVVEACMSLRPELDSFLDDVCGGPLIPATVLPSPTAAQRREPEAAAEGVHEVF